MDLLAATVVNTWSATGQFFWGGHDRCPSGRFSHGAGRPLLCMQTAPESRRDISCNAWEKPWRIRSLPCFPAVFPITIFTGLPTNRAEGLGKSISPPRFPTVFPVAMFTDFPTNRADRLAFQRLATQVTLWEKPEIL